MNNRGPVCQLYTGTQWHFLDPRPDEVRFDDLIGLARIARYLGATIEPYTVAEHCVRGALALMAQGHDRHTCLAFLLHDPEHIPPGDLPGPMVRYLEQEERRRRELDPSYTDPTLHIRRIGERAVWTAFDVLDVFMGTERSHYVWGMDKLMLATERRDLMAPSAVDWGPLPNPLPERIIPWGPAVAWRELCRTFDALGGVREPNRLAAVMGRWPGDESDEQIAAALRGQ
mgnify:FL=1